MQKQADEEFIQRALENAPEPIDMEAAMESLLVE